MRRLLLASTISLLGFACANGDTPAPVCGNGTVEAGEDCDDGNTTAGDGCSAGCQSEVPVPGCGNGVREGTEECDDGNRLSGDGCSSTCHNEAAVCGDGIRSGSEQCDDGNTTSGDGCSLDCYVEPSVCGNNIREGSEQCDDGNNLSGDGCSSTCMTETAVCGNGSREGTEQCDDGNTTSGDGCSATCRNEGAVCGNGTIEGTETCDDHNTTNGDGCSSTCTIEAVTCGNGVKEGGEACDDGNTANGDGCSSTCTIEGTGPACGNGVLEGTEACDDGNVASGDGCSSTCQREAGICGDGTLNSGEECDDGNTGAGDGCDATCHLEHAFCGDGVTDAGEECDDGNSVAFDGCSATCQLEHCGDGILQPGETCDDGNAIPGDGCSAFCVLEVPALCGDGILTAGEECDDGGTVAGDGCDATCHLETTNTCVPDWELSCGSTDSWNTTYSTATDAIDLYSACVGWNESGREYAYTFFATSTSTVRVALTGMSSDLDVFVLNDNAGVCAAGNCETYADATAVFDAVAGQTYYLVVDGFNAAEGPYSIAVTCGACGDGTLDPGEECDDGDLLGGDGCSPACELEGCGNGTVDVGEECDDDNNTPCDGCSATCKDEGCGNYVVECAEECDKGDIVAGDGCSATCQWESANATPDWDITCGGTDTYGNDTDNYGTTDVISFYSCVSWKEDGREYAYSFVAAANAEVTAKLTGMTADLDIFVLSGLSSETCIAYGSTQATFSATAATTYTIVVDGYQGAVSDYTLEISCAGGICGDLVVNAGEQCDNDAAPPTSNDGCSATCRNEICGDMIVQGPLGEECDDGNGTAGDGCSPTCQFEAGDCIPRSALSYQDVVTGTNNGVGSTDVINSYPSCPTGGTLNESGNEYAYEYTSPVDGTVTATLSGMTVDLDIFVLKDDGTGACDPTAQCIGYNNTALTFPVLAGEHFFIVVDGYVGAAGAFTLTLTATPASVCGDGTLAAGEECDDGDTTGGDGCDGNCWIEGGWCQAADILVCGDDVNGATTATGSTDAADEYSCSSWNESGREYAYRFTAETSGAHTVTLDLTSGADLDVFVLVDDGTYFSCIPGNCLDYGDSTVTFTAVAGTSYYIIAEGYNGASGSYRISLTCP